MKKYFWILLILISFNACKEKPLILHRIEGRQLPVDKSNLIDTLISKTIAPYKATLSAEMDSVLAYAPNDMYKGRHDSDKAETSIGNFMADLCYTQGNPVFNKLSGKNVDFVLLNFGGIRAGIPKGDVTVGRAYEVMPFENKMVVVELSYAKLQELFTYLASSKAHPISKQLHISFIDGKLEKATINDKKIDKNKTYHVLTSDYLQHGGDRMFFFKDPVKLYPLEYKIRTALLDELKAIKTIIAKEDGRMHRTKNH